MLLIFDLDDTLIQTTATFTPHQLSRVVVKMVEAGLIVSDVKEAIVHIQHLDRSTKSVRETLQKFLISYGQEEQFYEIGVKEAYENFSFISTILPMEGANEILKKLKHYHTLALVSAGVEKQQMAKNGKCWNRFSII